MNYSQYLEDGDMIQQQDGIIQELVDLVSRALQKDPEANQMLEMLIKQQPELQETVMQIAESLQSNQTTPSMKCGGKTAKKQIGGVAKKTKKAGCGCMLKKVGGRLIEVDGCTGLPIHRNRK